MKPVFNLGREFGREKSLIERRFVCRGDHGGVIVGTFFAGPKKTPPHMDGIVLIPFENDSVYFTAGEKKLQNEMGIGDLKGLFGWKNG
ncbi:MAG: hypothetical protein ACE5E9_08640 [Nitrospinaceae bacterium]